ncbi:cytochrome P450 [Punctularia strigosozonata HHB-11173 SS5]|uniref:cytochrome P450 n=1 Tax=Punctularia strigosozonata (strain HHB-11173) TaxID=741275 RepID=UPI00044180E8|nr:cytochrome P450 [Punctularia strigosozonata HHB-11173 SS5]EIN05570.1 cytochrome P450 [Punctularia strigosozonata HHB-11173 SS5]
MALTPGLVYVLKSLRVWSAPPIALYILSRILSAVDINVSGLLLISTCVLLPPAILLVRYHLLRWKDRRDAAAVGAILPPELKSAWPAGLGLDLMAAMKNSIVDVYPGLDTLLDPAYLELMQTLGLNFRKWSNEYGNTWRITVAGDTRYFTCEPDYVKAMLATDFGSFHKGPNVLHQNNSVLGTGVFNADGDLWKFHRGMTRPFFSKDKISHFELFDSHCDDALSQMRERLRQGCPVDFQDLVHRITMDCATQFLFGKDVCSLSAGLPYPNQPEDLSHPANAFAHAFLRAQSVIIVRARLGKTWPLGELWGDASASHMKIIYDFVDPLVTEALERKRRGILLDSPNAEKPGEQDVLLHQMAEATNDRVILRDEIMNMMVAGRDTTASTVTFAVYMLAEHPQVLHKLRSEILSRLGGQRRPEPDDFRQMKYLRAVINETLRLFPIVPFNSRESIKPTTWPSKSGGPPIYIPAGTRCLYSVLLMHRRFDLWGPDALDFDPDRFLDQRVERLTRNPMMFLPFNAGPRICLGQQFAYNEASFILVRLLQGFSNIQLALDAQPVDSLPPARWKDPGEVPFRQEREKVMPNTHLTLHVKGGLWVRMKEAQGGEVLTVPTPSKSDLGHL